VTAGEAPASRVRRLPRSVSFVVASFALVLVFAAAGSPVPLFNLYRGQDGVTNSDLGMISVGYFFAAAIALLVFGRLSNHLGRRPVAIAALTNSALSCLLLARVDGALPLLVARILQGVGCGLASSGLGSYAVDSAPSRPRWLAAVVTGSAPMVGVPLGALASGALAQYGPAPRVLVFELVGVLLVVCALLLAVSPETMTQSRGALASLRPRLQWPKDAGRMLVAAGAVFVATWSLGGFFQAFGPSVVSERLGSSSPLVTASVFASVMVLNPIGGPAFGRFTPSTAVRTGMVLFVLAVAGIVASLHAGAILPFIGASLVVGLAQGAASTGGIRALLAKATTSERAGLLATIYLISYSGTAVPGLIAGRLARSLDLFQIAEGYAVLGVGAALLAIITIGNTRLSADAVPVDEREAKP